jgi:hypothetical protein
MGGLIPAGRAGRVRRLRAFHVAGFSTYRSRGIGTQSRLWLLASAGLFFGVVGAIMAGISFARPALGAVAAPPAPRLIVDDGSFTRTTSVFLGFTDQDKSGAIVVAYRASNTGAVDPDGVLIDGQNVTVFGPWSLAAGPDGIRTIYGQIGYAGGLWSSVSSVSVTLETSAPTSIYIDLDPQPVPLPPFGDPVDWHARLSTPASPIFGGPNGPGLFGFTVGNAQWGVSFRNDAATAGPGTYEVLDPGVGIECGPICVRVRTVYSLCLAARGGVFTIHDIAWRPDGDLEMVAADFRVTCFGFVMAGSIRYGSSRPLIALDQTSDESLVVSQVVGTTSSPQAVTFTNIGDVPTALGASMLTGPNPGDFVIVADDCEGEVLDPGDSCAVATRFVPTTAGQREGFLTIPDETSRGSRRVRLLGYGFQPTTTELSVVSVPAFGPADATLAVTLSPPVDNPVLLVNGTSPNASPNGPPVDPTHRMIVLGPGTHTITASFPGSGFYLPSAAAPIQVRVGIKTSLSLATTTDDGVAAGETAQLIAQLRTGAAIPGGTLRIRDATTGVVLATKSVSGMDPSLTLPVTRALGAHPYAAEFLPPNSDVQAAVASYDLVVVAGPRPETVMDPSPLYTPDRVFGLTSFTSPDSGVAFECRYGESNWFGCESPWILFSNSDDAQVLNVRARRPNGLADRTPASRMWIIGSPPPSGSAATYVAVSPNRLLDTRDGTGLAGPFQTNQARVFQVANRVLGDATKNIPPTAIAVTGNLTVTGQTHAGWLTVTPLPIGQSTTSSLNFPVRDNRANGLTVSLGPGGTLAVVYNGAPLSATTHVLFDVTGYFLPGPSGASYAVVTPTRILDTRTGNGLAGPFGTDATRSFGVTNRHPSDPARNVPPNALAVTGNLTVTGQTHAGWLTVTPVAAWRPPTSTLNFPVGDNRANNLTVPLGPGGTLAVVFNGAPSHATAHVIFDVTGYFLPGTSGAEYVALSPNRILDSRDGTGLAGRFQNDRARGFAVTNRQPADATKNVPPTAIAVTGNLTVTGQTRAGWLTVTPGHDDRPPTSSLNFPVADNRANGVAVALGSGSLSVVYNGAATGDTTHAIFDVTGYFAP